MSMIDALIEGLGSGEQITCRVQRTQNGQVQVVFQPTLDGSDENGPGGRDDTERQVREALARPVKFTCTDDGRVSAQIDAALRDIAASRMPVHSALAEYAERLKDAQKAAQSAGQGQGTGQGAGRAKRQGNGAGAAAKSASEPASSGVIGAASASAGPSAGEAGEAGDASTEAGNPATLI